MNNFKFITISTLTILLTLGGISYAFFRNVGNNSNNEVSIGYVNIAQALPLFVAQEEGYFKDQGVDVNIQPFDKPNLFMDALVNGTVDYGAYTIATGLVALSESNNPGKVKIITSNEASNANPADVIVARKDLNINNLEDLNGKTCGTLAGAQFKVISNQINEFNGTNINFRELPVTEFIPSLANKSIDCILGLEPVGTIAEANDIGDVIGISPISESLGGSFWGGVSAVNYNSYKEKSSELDKVTNALDKAVDFISSQDDKSREYLEKYTNITEGITDKISIQSFRKSDNFSSSDKANMQLFINQFEDQGFIENEISIDELLLN